MTESRPPPHPSLRSDDLRLATSLVALATSKVPATEAVFGVGGVFPTAAEPRVRLALAALLYQLAAAAPATPPAPTSATAPADPGSTPSSALCRLFSYLESTLHDEAICTQVATGLRAAQLVSLTADPETFDSLCGTLPGTENEVAHALLATILVLVNQVAVARHLSPYTWFSAFAARQELSLLGVSAS